MKNEGINAPAVGIVAGEASGDLLGSLLIKALQQAGLNARFEGIAGPKMQGLGVRSLFPMETLSVRGYVEALGSLRRILAIRRQLAQKLLAAQPRLFIGIDAPDFNLGLEGRLKRRGIPTLHFVSPSVWAWRRGRIKKIRKAVSHMLLIFPFEEAIYAEADIPATYVGHPLAHALPDQSDRKGARERLGLRANGEYIALLPGSRQSELKLLADTFIETARKLHERRPTAQFLIPLISRETRLHFEEAIYRLQASELPIRILFGHAHDALQAADAALVASGTATLEAALLKCPHVITYKVPWLTYQIMRRQAYLPYIGLPNIVAGQMVVPELIQKQAQPELLAEAILRLLENRLARETMLDAFEGIRRALRRDTPRLIAEAIAPYLK
ncbi:lipid-A-disaccharide synthase [Sulfuritortus calidifontis]|uniref:Lipid-A-disaccharide synthase n=1 Tax=Sulfuritortus calidifontis TaxID=1914471 RepID=A0A4R3JVX7_9PROT|nr:lipid-A-disaccharide synthase [Sulfuritortus calidifontis]TCS71127.1 lipid-A-disaccharide synthase [Sulfuritortus calidifontis]